MIIKKVHKNFTFRTKNFLFLLLIIFLAMKMIIYGNNRKNKRVIYHIVEKGKEWLDETFEKSSDEIDNKDGGDIGFVIHEMLEELEIEKEK